MLAQPPVIEFLNVTKAFGDVLAVDHVNLSVGEGEFLSFLGPSGCGKTTSLRLIAGFEQPTSGDVRIAGHSVVGVPAFQRPVNMVFQSYALFPHLSVFDNIAFGLRQKRPRPSTGELAKAVDEALALVRLEGYGKRRTHELSGGQQQRVALARALINRPKVLLLDEPLAALDRKLRRDMQIELQNLQAELGITFVLVTHDQEEALSMSDRVCIMRQGRIVQMGRPRELYDAPVNRYVADFVGKSNFLKGRVEAGDSISLSAGTPAHARRPEGAAAVGQGAEAFLAIRPETMRMARDEAPLKGLVEQAFPGEVRNRIFLGEHTEYLVEVQGLGSMHVLTPRQMEQGTSGYEPGERVFIGWPKDQALLLTDN